MEEYKAMAKLFRESADTIDQLCDLEERSKTGEDVSKMTEELLGKLMVQMMKLNAL